jgi:hypothetical protein
MKHFKHVTKDNIATFLQTLLVLFLLGYSAVNGNSEAAQQTAPSNLTLQQSATIPQKQTIHVAAPFNQLENSIKKKPQKVVY